MWRHLTRILTVHLSHFLSLLYILFHTFQHFLVQVGRILLWNVETRASTLARLRGGILFLVLLGTLYLLVVVLKSEWPCLDALDKRVAAVWLCVLADNFLLLLFLFGLGFLVFMGINFFLDNSLLGLALWGQFQVYHTLLGVLHRYEKCAVKDWRDLLSPTFRCLTVSGSRIIFLFSGWRFSFYRWWQKCSTNSWYNCT